MSLALEMKRLRCKMGLFQKVMTCKLCQKENFENGVSLFKEFLAIRRAISLNETFVLFC